MEMSLRLSLAELAHDMPDVSFDETGRPLVPLVEITLEDLSDAEITAALPALKELSSTSILLGISKEPLADTPATRALVDSLDLIISPSAPKNSHAGSFDDVSLIREQIHRSPVAAITLIQVLRLVGQVDIPEALLIESFAYSSLLGGAEFRAWCGEQPPRTLSETDTRILLKREGSRLDITLNNPSRRNAFDSQMRDAFCEALDLAKSDSTITEVNVRGNGPAFCSGGDLAEFGIANDLAAAAFVRHIQSVARRIHQLQAHVRFEVHGPSVGAGVELASLASTLAAHENATFRLPEIHMGLIPGSGGTVGVAHRIGRWRTAYLTLTDKQIDRGTAHSWGLVDKLL